MKTPHFVEIRHIVRQLLQSCEIDLKDPNFKDTPERVAQAFSQAWLIGYSQKPEDVFKIFPNISGESDMVIVKDIPLYSMCAHHMAPFFGKAAIAYIPNGYVVGLSKMARVLDVFARRFQLQEMITKQTADAIEKLLDPLGVMVILYNVEHTCMTSRGIKAHGSLTTTSAVRGYFYDKPEVRQEALSLIFN